MDIQPFPTVDVAEKFLQFAISQREANKSIRYSLRVGGTFVGTVCVYSIYWHQNRASIGFALSTRHQRQGIMSQALESIETRLAVDHGIHRLQATVLAGNLASQRLLESRGYTFEGTLRDYEKWEGMGYVDLNLFSKLLVDCG